ncbi:hypothetical protein BC952_1061 [Flavobacterium limicola]|uniref:Uncharacterized protein n=1 Tax=Flavobacterium limicola TaxID=180441 RepID=A0A495S6Y5_9FLAO|nr:hypothetical protein [Flavobacterium limicola]RKS95389.1 hypothetical protein BC952_1061 [Flavobacterium limicola]
MTQKEKNDGIIFFVIIVGIGLGYFGYHLINNDNKKIGYTFIALGLVILFINAIIAILKLKK